MEFETSIVCSAYKIRSNYIDIYMNSNPDENVTQNFNFLFYCLIFNAILMMILRDSFIHSVVVIFLC